ncbi:MAG: FmdB family zinc ribbon protein [Planctomycetota bacterium]|jgi:putative FmdB family regulatory protein
MPTYDYECDACGHRFELFQSISADPEKKCPECKKLKLRRLIGTGAAVVFKGSGFYQTDYRSDSYKKSAAADSSSSSSSSSSNDASSASGSQKSTTDKTTPKSDGGSSSSSEKKSKKKKD